MRWSSWSEFWAMGGYALYVWGSFAVTALLMLIEVVQAPAEVVNAFEKLAGA